MSEPFVGEIKMFAGNFAPRGWATCDGQLLDISQNSALFSLLGTIYGGNGRSTFGIPDMRGRIPLHEGAGPGLTSRLLGSKGGSETVTLNVNQMPSHDHGLQCNVNEADQGSPGGHVMADSTDQYPAYNPLTADTDMHPDLMLNTGGSQPHENMMPSQCLTFIIALVGVFPSRT